MRYIIYIIFISMGFSSGSYAVSFQEAKQVYNRLRIANSISGVTLVHNTSDNAFAVTYIKERVTNISSGMLRMCNTQEIATVLGHELAHLSVGMYGNRQRVELRADKVGAAYAVAAGYNKCLGAKILLKLNQPANASYPSCISRYTALGC